MTMFPSLAKISRTAFSGLILGLLLVPGLAGCSMNHHGSKGSSEVFTAGDISITGSWAGAGTAGGNSAAYMLVTNNGREQDTLLSVASTAAEFTEVHQSLEEDGVSLMRKVRSLPIAPGETVALEPRSYHVMLIKLEEELVVDGTLSLTLTFEKSGDLTVTAPVMKAGGGHSHH